MDQTLNLTGSVTCCKSRNHEEAYGGYKPGLAVVEPWHLLPALHCMLSHNSGRNMGKSFIFSVLGV